VIDLFLYNGEPLGLYRLMYLKDYVDKFVVVESLETFQAVRELKESYFIDNTSIPILEELRLRKKLEVVRIPSVPMDGFEQSKPRNNKPNVPREKAWYREIYLRNIGMDTVYKVANGTSFILIHGDADEIPRPELVEQFPDHYDYIGDGKRLEMVQHVYNFKYLKHEVPTENNLNNTNKWILPFVITDKGILNHNGTSLHNMRANPYFRLIQATIPNAGWHCSWCTNADDIIRKIESFSHTERNNEKFKNREIIQNKIDSGKALFESRSLFLNECAYGSPYDKSINSNALFPFLKVEYCHEGKFLSKKIERLQADLTFPPKEEIYDGVSKGDSRPTISTSYKSYTPTKILPYALSSTCIGNLIVAAATGYSYRDVRTFLLSFNTSETSAHSLLLLLLKQDQANDTTLMSFISLFPKVRIEYVDSGQMADANSAESHHAAAVRFQWLSNYLASQSPPPCSVLSTDVRDVYFQGDIFNEVNIYKTKIGLDINDDYILSAKESGSTLVNDGKPMKEDSYHVNMQSCVQPIIKEVYDKFMENNILCSGTIIGSVPGLRALFGAMIDTMKVFAKIDAACLKKPMTDQIIYNMIIYEASTKNFHWDWIGKKNRDALEKVKFIIPSNMGEKPNPIFTLARVPLAAVSIAQDQSSPIRIERLPIDNYLSYSRDVPPLIHMYDRHPILAKKIRIGLQAAKGQKYGDTFHDTKRYTGVPKIF
jgi:hypothetical protein